jgi:predicted methyltransferase
MNGLLEYLGVKIGHDHECLHCNGRGRQSYPSLHAAREHMVRHVIMIALVDNRCSYLVCGGMTPIIDSEESL